MNVLAFDIETIPDVAGGRALHDLSGLSDSEIGEAMFRLLLDGIVLERRRRMD